MDKQERAIKELAEGLWQLSRAVESLAREQGNTNAVNQARRGKRAGSDHR